MSYTNSIRKSYGAQSLWVDATKPTRELDVIVVEIPTIHMYLLCKILDRWF